MDQTLPDAIADYVRAPQLVRDRSTAGFELIRDRIMHGELALDPDARRPGQIVDVTIRSYDQGDVGTRIIVELGLRTDDLRFTGASSAAIWLYSETGSSVLMSLSPVTESGSVVRGELTLVAPVQGGFWRPDQIIVRDQSDTLATHSVFDVGWKLFVD